MTNERASVKGTFSARFVITAAAVATLLGGLSVFALLRFFSEDDRSVIIVRGGSVDLELKKGEWDYASNNEHTKAHPVETNVADVAGFGVTFHNQDTGTNCPTATIAGDSVDIEYTPQSGSPETVNITSRLY